MKRLRFILIGPALVLAVSGFAWFAPSEAGVLQVPDASEQAVATATTLASSTTAAAAVTAEVPITTTTAPSPTVGQAAPAPTATLEPERPAVEAYPLRVRIPEIGVDADVIDLGLNTDGTLEVPSNFAQTGWYTGRSVPGEAGPSVVVGHVDSHSGPAVFYRLKDLEVGHVIEIDRSDGLIALYRVSEKENVLKDEFPTERVYGDTAEPTLRLVTCGGDFDRAVRSYQGNLIVFAQHLGNYEPIPAASAS
jgi:sortase (surface protein transpeptidase)